MGGQWFSEGLIGLGSCGSCVKIRPFVQVFPRTSYLGPKTLGTLNTVFHSPGRTDPDQPERAVTGMKLTRLFQLWAQCLPHWQPEIKLRQGRIYNIEIGKCFGLWFLPSPPPVLLQTCSSLKVSPWSLVGCVIYICPLYLNFPSPRLTHSWPLISTL